MYDWLIDLLIDWSIDWMIDWLIDWLIDFVLLLKANTSKQILYSNTNDTVFTKTHRKFNCYRNRQEISVTNNRSEAGIEEISKLSMVDKDEKQNYRVHLMIDWTLETNLFLYHVDYLDILID